LVSFAYQILFHFIDRWEALLPLGSCKMLVTVSPLWKKHPLNVDHKSQKTNLKDKKETKRKLKAD